MMMMFLRFEHHNFVVLQFRWFFSHFFDDSQSDKITQTHNGKSYLKHIFFFLVFSRKKGHNHEIISLYSIMISTNFAKIAKTNKCE